MRAHSLSLSLSLTHTHFHSHKQACTHSCSYIPMHTHVCTHMYAHAHTHQCTRITHICTHYTDTFMQKSQSLPPPPSPVGPAGHRGTCSASPMCQDTGGGSCPTGAQLWLGKYNTCSKTQGSGGINSALPSSSLSGHHLLSLPGATRVETYPL